jgi:hypothetical protein
MSHSKTTPGQPQLGMTPNQNPASPQVLRRAYNARPYRFRSESKYGGENVWIWFWGTVIPRPLGAVLTPSFLTVPRKRMDLNYSLYKLQIWAIGVPLTRYRHTFADLGPKFADIGLTEPRLPISAVSTRSYDPHGLSEELQEAQGGVLKKIGPRLFGRPGPPPCSKTQKLIYAPPRHRGCPKGP